MTWLLGGDARRAHLPQHKAIPAAKSSELTAANGHPGHDGFVQWHRSNGDSNSSRFSALDQIHRGNVKTLKVAWIYHSKDGEGNIQCNPIAVDGVLYAPTVGEHVVAIRADTGEELWRFKPEGRPAHRGLVYWKGDGKNAPRILFTAGRYLYALDPETGAPVAGFGERGKAPAGGVVAPAIYKHIVVVPVENEVKGFHVVTGELLWTFHIIPREGEFGHEKWEQPPLGANCWGGMAMDEQRGIAYFSTGSPHPNFIGVNHRGRNLFANSVIALKAETGRRLWHFQEIRHDIWDLDLPAPPSLVSITRDGRKFDAVAQVTKIGNTLLLDRVTGKPLFPFRLRRAPESKLVGEETWPYQPDLELPEPFARQAFTQEDVTDISPAARAFVLKQIANASLGWFTPFEDGKPNVFFGIHGGAEWMGAAFDPTTGWLSLPGKKRGIRRAFVINRSYRVTSALRPRGCRTESVASCRASVSTPRCGRARSGTRGLCRSWIQKPWVRLDRLPWSGPWPKPGSVRRLVAGNTVRQSCHMARRSWSRDGPAG